MGMLKPCKFTYDASGPLTSDKIGVTGDPAGLAMLLCLVDPKIIVSPTISSKADLGKYCQNLNLRGVVLRVGGDNGVSKEKLLNLLPLFNI